MIPGQPDAVALAFQWQWRPNWQEMMRSAHLPWPLPWTMSGAIEAPDPASSHSTGGLNLFWSTTVLLLKLLGAASAQAWKAAAKRGAMSRGGGLAPGWSEVVVQPWRGLAGDPSACAGPDVLIPAARWRRCNDRKTSPYTSTFTCYNMKSSVHFDVSILLCKCIIVWW